MIEFGCETITNVWNCISTTCGSTGCLGKKKPIHEPHFCKDCLRKFRITAIVRDDEIHFIQDDHV